MHLHIASIIDSVNSDCEEWSIKIVFEALKEHTHISAEVNEWVNGQKIVLLISVVFKDGKYRIFISFSSFSGEFCTLNGRKQMHISVKIDEV